MKMMTTPNPRSGARMSHGHEGARDEPNTKVEIGDKTAEEIMDDGSMDVMTQRWMAAMMTKMTEVMK